MFGFLKNLYTEIIASTTAERSTSKGEQISFITALISEFESSPARLYMDVAQKYYENENKILEAKRSVIGRDPETNAAILMDSKVLSNNTLSHNFLKKLTRQKIGYMLGKPFTLSTNHVDDEVASAMFEELRVGYFDMNFHKMLKNIGRDSIIKGISWLLVYYDEFGKLKFKRCASEEVIPIWADSDHTVLDAAIRKYTVCQYVGGTKKNIKFVDYYTKSGVFHFLYNDAGVMIPVAGNELSFHFNVKVSQDGVDTVTGVNWSNIPFIPFKYDTDEQSLLSRIKELVDDYDKKTSGISNNVDDFPNSMIVIKNYDGSSKEEFVHNKNQYRALFVQGDGDAKVLETPLNITEIDKHIQRLREDIYEFGQGVNTANKDIRDTSGVALRFMYADLDMDCVDWGSEFQWSIMLLVWFVQQDILNKKKIDYTAVEFNVIFNTDVIINETETVQNCFTSVGVISAKTIAENHPWSLDADKEVESMLADTEENLDLEQEYSNKANSSLTGQRSAK